IDVCRYTGYSEVNVSRALSRMNERGWVYRESDPNDRRKYRLELTAAGAELYNDLEPKARTSIADLKSQLSPSAERQVHKYLDKFIKIMEGIVSRK
ncbi:MAG: winged helix DNA-binding protein, partial [Pseudomonadales bacterium]|nr:winged helix DNA-binding protein [Pseudomonadales bacterium]